jgi:hypothetical protein
MAVTVVLLALAVPSGCSGGRYESTGGGAGQKYAGKRSLTCLSWQDEMCDFISDRCQAQTRVECDALYQSLFCKDDSTMQACIAALGSATCPLTFEVPQACKDLNDPAPVTEFCQEFGAAVCRWAVRCGQATDQKACEAQTAVELAATCAGGVGLSPSADACLGELVSLACDAKAPGNCDGVIKVLSSPTSGKVVLAGVELGLVEARRAIDPEALPMSGPR